MIDAKLAGALVKFQADLPDVAKTGVAQYGKYADLADVSKVVLKALAQQGLAFTARPTVNAAGQLVLAYSLLHESGEHMDGEYPLHGNGPQQLGGAITYARRYCLCAVTGVAADEDDDGKAAQGDQAAGDAWETARPAKPESPPREARRPARPAAANGRAPDTLHDGQPGSATEGQVAGIQITYQKLGFTRGEREHLLEATEKIIGRPLTGPNEDRTHKNLSRAEAVKVRKVLDGCDDRGHLIALLAEGASA